MKDDVLNKVCIRKKSAIVIGGFSFLLITIVFYVLFVQFTENTRTIINTRASDVDSLVKRGFESDKYADIILGKKRFQEVIPKEIVHFKLAGPAGAFVDKNDRLYLFDGMNSRILGYKSIGTCNISQKTCSTNLHCESYEKCILNIGNRDGKRPDIVIGQPSDTDHAACNGDGSFISFPIRKSSTASTICSVREDEQSYFEGGSSAGMSTDTEGNLYFPDSFNHRVLKYVDPFETNTIADEVWGQINFTLNQCNRGEKNPNNESLCLVHENFAKPAVFIDKENNLWVADIGNNRILRFPYNIDKKIQNKQADVVLGQSAFNEGKSNKSLDGLNAPNGIFVDSKLNVFVSDYYNNRIIKYAYPQVSGMKGEVVLNGLNKPHAISIDEIKKLMYVSTQNWIEVYNLDNYSLRTRYEALDSFGTIGIFNDSSIIFTNSNSWQNVIIRSVNGGEFKLFTDPKTSENSFSAHNFISNWGFYSLRGIAITKTQLIVADAYRLNFWDTTAPTEITNGTPVSGYFGTEGKPFAPYSFMRIAKGINYLWVLTNDFNSTKNNTIQKYKLPVTQGQTPEETIRLSDIPILDSTESNSNKIMIPSDIYVDEQQEYMWVSLPWNDRVVRIRIPGKHHSTYIIDAIIGGYSIKNRTPGWELKCSDHPHFPQSLCYPGSLNEDKLGNLIISDMMIENAGSKRMLIYKNEQVPFAKTLTTLNATDAFKILSDAQTWKPTFNSANTMVVGHYPFSNTQNNRFPSIIKDILNIDTFSFDEKINDFYANAFTAEFDERDNLYLADLNRGSLYIYKNPIQSKSSNTQLKKSVKIQAINSNMCTVKGQTFFKACNTCAPSTSLLSDVCPSYCVQFNGNIDGCVASQNRGFGCVWHGNLNSCKSHSDNTDSPYSKTKTDMVLFSGKITIDYEEIRPSELMVVVASRKINEESWKYISSRKVSVNPESNIPYAYAFYKANDDGQVNFSEILPQTLTEVIDSLNKKKTSETNTELKLENGFEYKIDLVGMRDNSIMDVSRMKNSDCTTNEFDGINCIFTKNGSVNITARFK